MMRHFLILGLLLAVWPSVCRAKIDKELLTAAVQKEFRTNGYMAHIIAVDKYGSAVLPRVTKESGAYKAKMIPWVTEETQNAKPDSDWQRAEFEAYMVELFKQCRKEMESGKKKRIMIYIHGGLNRFESAAEHAAALTDRLDESDIYPIFIVWSSSWDSTYLEHLFMVREGMVQPAKAIVTSPFQFLADTGGALARAPLAVTKLFYSDIYSLNPRGFSRRRQAEDRYKLLRKTYLDFCHGDPSGATRAASGVVAVSEGEDERSKRVPESCSDIASWALWEECKIGMTPIVDSLGGADWRNMLRRTRVMFDRETNFVTEEKPPEETILGAESRAARKALQADQKVRWGGRDGALKLFFERAQVQLGKAGGGYPPIDIIGHSMGAIVLGEILQRFPGIRFQNIICMAAACTVNDFNYKYAPYLGQPGCQTQFYNLCLNDDAEHSEREPMNYVEPVPRGSLLLWIDTMLDDPISENDRTLGRWENAILTTDALPSNIAGRVTLKAFGRDRLPVTGGPLYTYEDKSPQTAKYVPEPTKHGALSNFQVPPKPAQPNFSFWQSGYWTAEKQEPNDPKSSPGRAPQRLSPH